MIAALLVGLMLLGAAWDADGNPTTDNAPQIVLESCTARAESAAISAARPRASKRLRRLTRRPVRRMWRSFTPKWAEVLQPGVVPARGP